MSDITESTIIKKLAEVSVPSRLGVKNTLGPITALMDRLGHPELGFPSIHVGGTSGKGSTATFIANILRAAGYRVGLFTKPHLSSVRERFVIDGNLIPAQDMLEVLDRLGANEVDKPTWFELMTALAFQYFKDQRVDLGVIEVGLGGSYDATNVLQPEVSVLTNVGLDHTDILGDTVEEIASDKVGIIKPCKWVVSGVTQPSVMEIVEQKSQAVGAKLRLLGRDFNYENLNLTEQGSHFDFRMADQNYKRMEVKMLGQHQVLNATLACAAARTLSDVGYRLDEAAIRKGLAQTQVPGRMEIVAYNPIIMLDAAHSPPKMTALADALHDLFGARRVIGVLAFSQGHDAQLTFSKLGPRLHTAIFTGFNAMTDYGSRLALPAGDLVTSIAKDFPSIEYHIETDPFKAIELAKRLAGPQDLICITGSIFLVAQVRSALIAAS